MDAFTLRASTVTAGIKHLNIVLVVAIVAVPAEYLFPYERIYRIFGFVCSCPTRLALRNIFPRLPTTRIASDHLALVAAACALETIFGIIFA